MTDQETIVSGASGQTEITLKEVIVQVRKLVRYLLAKWHLFLLVGLLAAAAGYYYAYSTKVKYTGSLTFVLAGESKSSSGLMSLASQFGMENSGGGADVFQVETILDFMKSFYVIKKVLYKPESGTDSIFANFFARELKLDIAWKNNPRVNRLFPFPATEDRLTPLHDSLLKELHDVLIGNFLDLNRPSKNRSFYEARTTASNELIAAYLPKYIVEETANLYIETQTAQSMQTVKMLQHEVDSLSSLLGSSITDVASIADRTFNLNPALQVQRSSSQRKQVNVSAISGAYAQLLQSLQMAKLALQKEKPLFKIIDQPEMPLKIIRARKIVTAFIWAFIAEIVLAFFLIVRNFLKHVV